jgi:hypothetical protein
VWAVEGEGGGFGGGDVDGVATDYDQVLEAAVVASRYHMIRVAEIRVAGCSECVFSLLVGRV